MHHSFQINILDLDRNESIFEQDITDVEAEKIVGGNKISPVVGIIKAKKNVEIEEVSKVVIIEKNKKGTDSCIPPMDDPYCPPM
jgi:hypothetical protein